MQQGEVNKIKLERVLERNRLLEIILKNKEEEINSLKQEINNNMADRDLVSMMLSSLLSELNTNNYPSKVLDNETNLNKINQIQVLLLDALRDKREALSEALSRSRFLAKMSHEIRTPMNGIMGITKLLSKTILDEKQKNYIRAIENSSETLLTVINEILDISKIQSGKLVVENKPFEFKEFLSSVINVFEGKAKENGIDLIKDYNMTDLPTVILGDSFRLNQILYNLISNAIKFTKVGYVKLSVKKKIFKESKCTIEFTVSDTGIGISRDKQAYIFNEFTQANEDTTRKFGGTGLGLSIVKKLIEIQSGSIRVKSKEDVGSSFIVNLKFGIGKESDLLIDNKESEAYDFSGVDVLLVEDNDVNKLVARELLESKKCKVTVVSNGKEAFDILNKTKFHLVLMDMQMPVMDGYTAIRNIRNCKEISSALPIIALTAHTSQSIKDKCFKVGASEYLQKPYSASSLYDIISKLLSKNFTTRKEFLVVDEIKDKVDFDILLNHVDGNLELANKLLNKIKVETLKDVIFFKEAVAIKNLADICQLIHKIKPSIKMLGGNSLYIEMECIESEITKLKSLIGLDTRIEALIYKLTCFFD